MKRPASLSLVLLIYSYLTNFAFAHPGHGWGDAGIAHWLTSSDHLLVLGGGGLAVCWLGRRLRNRTLQMALSYTAVALVLAAVLWGVCS